MIVRFFAQLRSITGVESLELNGVVPADAEALWQELLQRFPGLESRRRSTRLARNHEYIGVNEKFAANDEIALIPPVSGG